MKTFISTWEIAPLLIIPSIESTSTETMDPTTVAGLQENSRRETREQGGRLINWTEILKQGQIEEPPGYKKTVEAIKADPYQKPKKKQKKR